MSQPEAGETGDAALKRTIPPFYRRTLPAKGVKTSPTSNYNAITCYFDDDTFDTVKDRAQSAEVSFSEMIRRLVEWGLMETRK